MLHTNSYKFAKSYRNFHGVFCIKKIAPTFKNYGVNLLEGYSVIQTMVTDFRLLIDNSPLQDDSKYLEFFKNLP